VSLDKFIYKNRRKIRSLLSKKNKKHRIISGHLKDYKIFTNWHDYPSAILGRTEKDLLVWFSKNIQKGETWIDVGANYGYTTIALEKYIGDKGKIFAFEPVPSTCAALLQTIHINNFKNVSVYCLALGDESALSIKHFKTSRGMLTNEDDLSSLGIPLISFDQIWASNTRDTINGIKIDVDGQELEVLIGMKTQLKEYHPKIILEVHDLTYNLVNEFLIGLGYKKSLIINKPFYAKNSSVENSNILYTIS